MVMVMVVMMMMVPVRHDHDARGPTPVMVVVMMVVMVLRELHPRLVADGTLLLIHRLQDLAGIGDRLEEVGVGIGVQNIRRRRQRCGLS